MNDWKIKFCLVIFLFMCGCAVRKKHEQYEVFNGQKIKCDLDHQKLRTVSDKKNKLIIINDECNLIKD